MKNMKKQNNMNKKGKFKPGSKKRENKCIVTFDDNDRQEYLTGFHKRKVERRKAAVVEIQKKIKEEQKRVREQRHKEYIKMLKERTDALDEIEEEEDELEAVITDTTESQQYDHPNHTVTVTTISELDLTGASLLGRKNNEVNGECDGENEEEEEEDAEKWTTMPKKANDPILNKKICSLTASLHAHTKRRKKGGKQDGRRGRGRPTDKSGVTKRKKRTGKTTKKQRRQQTGKREHFQE